VTRAADIIEMLSPLSVPDALTPGGPQPSAGAPDAWPLDHGAPSRAGMLSGDDDAPCRDELDADCARVLDALPARGGAGTSTIAVEAGVDLDAVLRCLGQLAGLGFIERCDRGWRLRKHSRG
jgi:hypothetical protein